MEYYSAVKKNKIMKLTGKRMKLETIILSPDPERQTSRFSIICGSYI